MANLFLTLGDDFVPNVYVWRDTYQAGVDVVNGGDGDDTIGGDPNLTNAETDIFNGGDDDDVLIGRSGSDILDGEDGDDILYGDIDGLAAAVSPRIFIPGNRGDFLWNFPDETVGDPHLMEGVGPHDIRGGRGPYLFGAHGPGIPEFAVGIP